MNNGKKRLKIAALLFAMMFVVGTAFAATNGMLAFGGTVRINSVGTVEKALLEFVDVNTRNSIMIFSGNSADIQGLIATNAELVTNEFGQNVLSFDVNLNLEIAEAFVSPKSEIFFQTDINFIVENTGNVPIRLLQIIDESDVQILCPTIDRSVRGGSHIWLRNPHDIGEGGCSAWGNHDMGNQGIWNFTQRECCNVFYASLLSQNHDVVLEPGEFVFGGIRFNFMRGFSGSLSSFLYALGVDPLSTEEQTVNFQFILDYEQAY